jgi:hypothetical protein
MLVVLGVVLPLESEEKEQAVKRDMTDTEKVFREWGNFFVGGIWTGTDARGDKYEQRFEWILNESFLQMTWKITGDSGVSVCGIDPGTGQLTGWAFDDKGRVWNIIVTVDKEGEWTEKGTGKGKMGTSSWKAKFTKRGADMARVEILENVLDGKKLRPK